MRHEDGFASSDERWDTEHPVFLDIRRVLRPQRLQRHSGRDDLRDRVCVDAGIGRDLSQHAFVIDVEPSVVPGSEHSEVETAGIPAGSPSRIASDHASGRTPRPSRPSPSRSQTEDADSGRLF